MLQITIPSREVFDESTETFFKTKEYVLNLEHSLLSISKWESKTHKPFLTPHPGDPITPEEMLEYIKCMTLNKNIPDHVYLMFTSKDMEAIRNYINDPMTATTVSSTGAPSRDIITSEVIYYWMVSYNIPFECEKWHINRLIMLVRVCGAMNEAASNKKRRPDLIARKRLNDARLAEAKKRQKGAT